MKNSLKLISAALAAVSAMTSAGVTAFADKLKTVDGVMYRVSDSGEVRKAYTGWAKTKKGKVCYKNGIKLTGNAVINGICYSFGKNGILKGRYTGLFTQRGVKRCYKGGTLVTNAALRFKSGELYVADGKGALVLHDDGEANPNGKAATYREVMYGGERLYMLSPDDMMYGDDGKVYTTPYAFPEDESFDPQARVNDELTALTASEKPAGKLKYVTGELTDDFDTNWNWRYEWNVFVTRESDDNYWLTMLSTEPNHTYKGQNVYQYFKALRYVYAD